MNDFEIKLLEQKVAVMQKEVGEVLNEMQVTIQALTKTYGTAIQAIWARLDALEKVDAEEITPERTDGKEL